MPERVAQLSRQSQVPEAELQRLRAGAALVDLKGLGAPNYNALRRLGIFTIEDLAQRVPTVLLPRWRAAVAERPPSLAQVTLWIRAARRQTGLAPPQPSAFAHRGYGSTTHN
jgi:predicted RecB family nuclease